MERVLFGKYYYDDSAVITNDSQICKNEDGDSYIIKWLNVEPFLFSFLDGQLQIVSNCNIKEVAKCIDFGECRDNGKYAVVYPSLQVQPIRRTDINECLSIILGIAKFISSAPFPHGNLCQQGIDDSQLWVLEYHSTLTGVHLPRRRSREEARRYLFLGKAHLLVG